MALHQLQYYVQVYGRVQRQLCKLAETHIIGYLGRTLHAISNSYRMPMKAIPELLRVH